MALQGPSYGGTTRIVAMDGFDHLLNWKLKRGSHPFPGLHGGTCINEAALVAAGFQYKPIRSAEEMPECFSRPICNLVIEVNDQASDADRQRLLPYVTRLACADSPKVEAERSAYIDRHLSGYPHCFPFEAGLQALVGALGIGRQADPLGPEEVRTRMEAVRPRRSSLSLSTESYGKPSARCCGGGAIASRR
jgi:hypothetical protein